MIRRKADAGFSAVELLFVVAIVGTLAAVGVPISGGMIDDIRLRGDAQGVSGALALTKMTAAAKFTRARLVVNVTAGTYRIESWRKTGTPGWAAEGGDVLLSNRDTFGSGAATTPPPNSQAVLGQPSPCLADDGTPMTGTACVIYNSRGIPVSSAGVAMTTQVLYMRGPTGIFGTVIGGTGQQQVWRTTLAAGGTWKQQ